MGLSFKPPTLIEHAPAGAISDRIEFAPHRALNILHVMRAPVGGLFRHVLDLARGQTARGHRVGMVPDAATGGAEAEIRLARVAPWLSLGVTRIGMSRHLGPHDAAA